MEQLRPSIYGKYLLKSKRPPRHHLLSMEFLITPFVFQKATYSMQIQ